MKDVDISMMKFMGYRFSAGKPFEITKPDENDWFFGSWIESEFKEFILEYYSDWEFLMKVVEKVEATYDEFHGYFGVHIYSNSCTIQGTKLHFDDHHAYFDQQYAETKIAATYQALENAIKFINSLQKA